uniref:Uncharacterized protein n=1 Tax=Arundo donax TaxID=35708 RepID=A0A0A8ZPT9_ARUDO
MTGVANLGAAYGGKASTIISRVGKSPFLLRSFALPRKFIV